MNDYGLVLAGGSARGAYQVGVMRYVFCDLAKRMGHPTWPSLISGTSVGAQNAVFAAAQSQIAVERLAHLWRNLTIDQIYRLRWTNVVGTIRGVAGSDKSFALLDPTPFYEVANQRFPRGFLRRSIDSGSCHALILSATEVDSGYNALFIDSADPDFGFESSPGTLQMRVRIQPQHVFASGALPVLFPPVEVGGTMYLDGGLRQNTPLRPILRAGASKVLVVGLKRSTVAPVLGRTITPNLPFLLGKTFNALMLDPVERDIEQAMRMNEILDWGTMRFGDAFSDEVRSDLGLQQVEIAYLKPREDLGVLAAEVFQRSPPRATPQVKWLLNFIADRANNAESDLLSYVYFDSAYTALLERLGWEDARDREEELAALIGDGPRRSFVSDRRPRRPDP